MSSNENRRWTFAHMLAMTFQEESIINNQDVMSLLKRDANTPDKLNGRTPLHMAVQCRKEQMYKILVEHCNAIVDFQDDLGMTPYHIAALNRDHPAMAYLLEHGADDTKEDNEGFTPYDYLHGFGREIATHED